MYSSPKIQKWKTDKGIQQTAAKISGYAATDPLEYVADVGAGLAGGQTFDKDVMVLYEVLKGPKI